jgi:hypothetical protein
VNPSVPPHTHPRPPHGTPARPPFAFTLTAPTGWAALRGDAPSLHDDLLALVVRTPVWAQLDPRRRRGLSQVLDTIAQVSATTGAVTTLLHLGDDTPPAHQPAGADPAVSAITLTWLRTAPILADLALARLVLGDGEPLTTGLGPGLVDRRIQTSPTGQDHITTQVAAPLPASIWIAVLTGTTTSLGSAPTMDDALLAVAASLHTT